METLCLDLPRKLSTKGVGLLRSCCVFGMRSWLNGRETMIPIGPFEGAKAKTETEEMILDGHKIFLFCSVFTSFNFLGYLKVLTFYICLQN